MYTKIVEGHLEPLWLKVIVGTYEPEEVKQNPLSRVTPT